MFFWAAHYTFEHILCKGVATQPRLERRFLTCGCVATADATQTLKKVYFLFSLDDSCFATPVGTQPVARDRRQVFATRPLQY